MELLDITKASTYSLKEGSTAWSSPSNIAMIKYWGKYKGQIPANPSLSFTLDACKTETAINYRPNEGGGLSIDFEFEGNKNQQFSDRISKYLNSISSFLPVLKDLHLKITSSNTFPHSSGIASSASSMSALAVNLVEIHNNLSDSPFEKEEFLKLSSYIARLGSGSACRSVYGGFTVWGESEYYDQSSDLFAVPVKSDNISPVFKTLCDDILIIEKGAKKVSSSAGHDLMHDHPFAKNRFDIARQRMGEIGNLLKEGNVDEFGKLVEKEALMLHSMMMTSDPYFILFKPNTLSVIERIWEFRREKGLPVYFTLDAGANVHLIYPSDIKEVVSQFVKDDLLVFCENASYLCDRVGEGPINLNP